MNLLMKHLNNYIFYHKYIIYLHIFVNVSKIISLKSGNFNELAVKKLTICLYFIMLLLVKIIKVTISQGF